jgi:transcription elongation factor GreA
MEIPILRSTHKILTEKIAGLKRDIDGNSRDIGEAAALGDLKENSAYHAAKERQVLLLEKMQRFKGYLKGRVIDASATPPEKVLFGTQATVVDAKTRDKHLFNLVGPVEYELDLLPDMVTFAAPVAKLLMGKKVGDVVEFKFGSNEWTGEITAIKSIE